MALALTACDIGDGTQLQPYDPADYPAPETTTVEPVEPLDTLAAPDPVETAVAVTDATEPFVVFGSWADGASIDPRYTCDGDNVSPSVSWSGVPEGTVEVALAFVDDSAVIDGQPFVHWVITGLDPAESGIAEDAPPEAAVQALNFFGAVGYGGPCPPPGAEPHRYRLTAYALNAPVERADGSVATDFLDDIAQLTIRSTDLTGTYQR
jgi:Raf kinase inhibitor-like YbhB/YbcL family protein